MPVVWATPGVPKPISPPGGGTTLPLLIMVIADGYRSGDEAEFDYDVENFFKYGLLVDNYYKNHVNEMRIMSYFDVTPTGQASLYGFTLAPGAGNCPIQDDPTPGGTADKLDATLSTVTGVPAKVHYIVLGNLQYDFGCSNGMWSYVAVGAVGTDILQHEFGHRLAALFDEWELASNGATTYPKYIPPTDIRNCSTTTPPNWATLLPSPPAMTYNNVAGCDLYKYGVVHPYNDCRMGATHHRAFCAVCANAMNSAFLDLMNPNLQSRNQSVNLDLVASHDSTPSPRFGFVNAAFVQPVPAQPAPPTRMARLVVEFDPDAAKPTLRVKRRSYVTGTYTPSYRRISDYIYAIVDNTGATLEYGVVNGQLLEARGYRGSGGHHASGPAGGSDIIIPVPNEDQKTFQDGTRNLQLVMYRIPRDVTYETISRARFKEVQGKLIELVRVSLQ